MSPPGPNSPEVHFGLTRSALEYELKHRQVYYPMSQTTRGVLATLSDSKIFWRGQKPPPVRSLHNSPRGALITSLIGKTITAWMLTDETLTLYYSPHSVTFMLVDENGKTPKGASMRVDRELMDGLAAVQNEVYDVWSPGKLKVGDLSLPLPRKHVQVVEVAVGMKTGMELGMRRLVSRTCLKPKVTASGRRVEGQFVEPGTNENVDPDEDLIWGWQKEHLAIGIRLNNMAQVHWVWGTFGDSPLDTPEGLNEKHPHSVLARQSHMRGEDKIVECTETIEPLQGGIDVIMGREMYTPTPFPYLDYSTNEPVDTTEEDDSDDDDDDNDQSNDGTRSSRAAGSGPASAEAKGKGKAKVEIGSTDERLAQSMGDAAEVPELDLISSSDESGDSVDSNEGSYRRETKRRKKGKERAAPSSLGDIVLWAKHRPE